MTFGCRNISSDFAAREETYLFVPSIYCTMFYAKEYIPNPQKWVDYFKKIANKESSMGQTGDGRSCVIPIDAYASGKLTTTLLPLTIVSPAEQTVEQSQSELKRKNVVLPGDNKERNLRHTSKKRKQITVIP